MPLIEITAAKSWMKRTGSWFSDAWNYLANIQYILQNQMISVITRTRFYTVGMPVANRQYSFAFPANTKAFEIQTTSGVAFRVSFDPGRVGPIAKRPYWSVATNTSWDKDKLNYEDVTLYFACATAGQTMELAIDT